MNIDDYSNDNIYNAIDYFAQQLNNKQKLILFSTFPVLNRHPLKNYPFLSSGIKYNYSICDNNREAILKLTNRHPNVFLSIFLKVKFLIQKKNGYYNDTLIYNDRGHINTFGSLKLVDNIGNDFYILLKSL